MPHKPIRKRQNSAAPFSRTIHTEPHRSYDQSRSKSPEKLKLKAKQAEPNMMELNFERDKELISNMAFLRRL